MLTGFFSTGNLFAVTFFVFLWTLNCNNGFLLPARYQIEVLAETTAEEENAEKGRIERLSY
jgi:hypothetical protein